MQHEVRLPSHGSVSYIEDQDCEADSLIAAHAKKKMSDVVVSSDSSLLAHLGDDGLFVKDFRYRTWDLMVSELVLSAAGKKETLGWSCALEWTSETVKARITKRKYAVFDGVSDPHLRAFIAVALGSHVWPGGITDFG